MSISRIPSLLVKRKLKYDKSSTGDVLDVLTTMLRISNSIVKHQTFNSMRLVISEGGTCMAMRMSWSKNKKNDDEEPISIVNSSHLPRRFQKLYVSSCIMLLCIIKLILLYMIEWWTYWSGCAIPRTWFHWCTIPIECIVAAYHWLSCSLVGSTFLDHYLEWNWNCSLGTCTIWIEELRYGLCL